MQDPIQKTAEAARGIYPMSTKTIELEIKQKPRTVDVSHRAMTLARIVDRLSPGSYNIEVVKDHIESVDWKVTVTREEMVQRVSLAKGYNPE